VLNLVLLSAIVLQVPNVAVAPARVSLVTNEARLHQICGVEGKLSACTLFVGFRLKANCSSGPWGWRITASAQFRPLMFLLEGRAMKHEYDHVADVRESVQRYLAELEQRHFPAEEACQDETDLARSGFKEQMQRAARDSHVKRHPGSNLRFLGQK
jgi:hypothetical protein